MDSLETSSLPDGRDNARSPNSSRTSNTILSGNTRQQLNEADAERRLQLEKADNSPGNSRTLSTTSFPEPLRDPEKRILAFEPNDSENPYNWSKRKKAFVVVVSIIAVLNSTMNSSVSSNASPYFAKTFHNNNSEQLILPTSIYLVGYTLGPIVFGPLSEQYGRKYVMMSAFFFFTLFTMGAALAPNFPAFIIFRLLTGIAASCPIAVVGGTCADVYNTPQARGRAMALFMAATTWGPCGGPVISGYISVIDWRWSFWVLLIFAGATWIPLLLVPETLGPVLLKRRAQRIRKKNPTDEVYAAIELEQKDLSHVITVVLSRPLRMFCFEALVLFTCLYTSFAYAIFYMLLVAYPIVYERTYGFSTGEEGLTFLTIGVGAIIASAIYLTYDVVLRRAHARDAPWSRSEETRRLPLACLAGPFFVISCFWVGWTARKDVHWTVPVLSGIPFGIGYLLLFMALLNYLVDAYKVFAASAMAAASASRSVFGAVLPFATGPMYESLGVPWACSLLGFLSVLMSVIPFVFLWKGDQIRARSKFCQYLEQRDREEKEKEGSERDQAADAADAGKSGIRDDGRLDTAEEKV